MPFQSSIPLDLTIVKNFKILTILKCNQTSYLLVPGDPVVWFGRDQYRSKGLGKDYRLKLVTCQWRPLFIWKNVFFYFEHYTVHTRTFRQRQNLLSFQSPTRIRSQNPNQNNGSGCSIIDFLTAPSIGNSKGSGLILRRFYIWLHIWKPDIRT